MSGRRAWVGVAGLLLIAGVSGCVGGAPTGSAGAAGGVVDATARAHLKRVGLEVIDDDAALIPEAERGHYIPVIVIEGFPSPALPPDPAGYLLVRLRDAPNGDRSKVEQALKRWKPGETIDLVVRRNPYYPTEPEWWEADVKLRMPR